MIAYKDIVLKCRGKRELLLQEKEALQQKMQLFERKQHAIEEVQILVQTVAKETQEQIKMHIEDVVNAAINTCFPDEYAFSLEFEIKRGKTEATIKFTKNGFDIDPMEATGGGLVDVASFALRVAAWSLSSSTNILILDEPMKFLSRDLQNKAGEILQEISKELNIQIIMVSHIQDIIGQADKVFEVRKLKNVSTILSYDMQEK